MKWPALILFAALAVIPPAVLIVSSLRTLRTVGEQQELLLRSRAAAVAARLELESAADVAAEERAVSAIEIYTQPEGAPAEAAAIWAGQALFRVQRSAGLFRAWLPFHSRGALRVARIDIDAAADRDLLAPTRQNVAASLAAAVIVFLLSLAAGWSWRRAVLAQRRQSELAHLAHLGELSATLAHEIRNPLGTIKGFAQLLAERLRGEEAELTAPIVSETERLERLVRDLLAYGRQRQPEPRRVESGGIAALLRPSPDPTGPVWSEAVEDFELVTDPDLLEQALLNLVRNALEAAGAGGTVRLEIRRAASSAVFHVIDSGPGLSVEAQRRLFQPFHTTKAAGTGLGLAVSRSIVIALGGAIRLENRPQGGVTAEIRLPLQPARQGETQ